MKFEQQDRDALLDAHVRLVALEAWVLTLGIAVAANVRPDGISPAKNAEMITAFAHKITGTVDDGGPGSAILSRIDHIGRAIVEGTETRLIAGRGPQDGIQ